MKKDPIRKPRNLPAGARRTTNAEGKRVWEINGREFTSRRDYWEQLRKRAEEVALAANPNGKPEETTAEG